MLPYARNSIFQDDRYIFEPALNGHRLLVRMARRKVTLFTRYLHDCTSQYPELFNVPVDEDVILDGEVVLFDELDRMDVQGLMSRYRLTRPAEIRLAAARSPVRYYVFDLLHYQGRDLRTRPLQDRRRLLNRVLTDNSYYRPLPYWEDRADKLYAWAQDCRLPGVIAKRKDSPYLEGRSEAWLKILTPEHRAGDSSRLFEAADYGFARTRGRRTIKRLEAGKSV
jgi:DNA ligase-1